MCFLQSADIMADGSIYLGGRSQSHYQIARTNGLGLDPITGHPVDVPFYRGEKSYSAFELTPWNWQGKSLGPEFWLDEKPHLGRRLKGGPLSFSDLTERPETLVEYETFEAYDAPDHVMEAGQKLADKLSMAEEKVDGLPWITIVRSGTHELGEVEYLVTYGDSEVRVKSAKQIWAFDHSVVRLPCDDGRLITAPHRQALLAEALGRFLIFDQAVVLLVSSKYPVLDLYACVEVTGPRTITACRLPYGTRFRAATYGVPG